MKKDIEKAIESFKKRNIGLKNNPVCQDVQERVDKQNYEIVRNNLAIEALEKQIPKKIKIINYGTSICPDCNCNLHRWYTHCPDCGQKLDREANNE